MSDDELFAVVMERLPQFQTDKIRDIRKRGRQVLKDRYWERRIDRMSPEAAAVLLEQLQARTRPRAD